MEKRKLKPEEALMEAIGFTEEDLEANRDGRITEFQLSRLKRYRQSWSIWLTLAIGACPVGSILAIIDGLKIHDTVVSRLGIIGLICMVCGVIAIYAWLNKRRFAHDVKTDEICIAEGRVRLNITERGNMGTHYNLMVQNKTLSVNRPILLAFKNGDPYIIYYTPRTKTILSAEWLRGE